jgi:GNAT superfamily N-acetyltransferase
MSADDTHELTSRVQLWRAVLDAAGWPVVVIDGATGVVGFCHLSAARDADLDANAVAEITALYVDPLRWRHGYGRQLAESAFIEATRRKRIAVALWALADDSRACGFYEAIGFAIDGARKTGSDGSREVRYVKPVGR